LSTFAKGMMAKLMTGRVAMQQEELNGISATANHAVFFYFVPWFAGLSSSSIVLQELLMSCSMYWTYT
jgi:hypothetical protein